MAGTSKPRITDAVDEADNVPRQVVDRGGKRVKAFPFSGGTTIVIRDVDFSAGNVKHSTVTWDYRINDFTVEVGKEINEEAANYLVNNFPDSFKFV